MMYMSVKFTELWSILMDKTIYVIEGVGEYGLDLDHSPGVGGYYVKLYDGSYDASGFDTEKEAREELEYLVS
jgi:hypothetical protein